MDGAVAAGSGWQSVQVVAPRRPARANLRGGPLHRPLLQPGTARAGSGRGRPRRVRRRFPTRHRADELTTGSSVAPAWPRRTWPASPPSSSPRSYNDHRATAPGGPTSGRRLGRLSCRTASPARRTREPARIEAPDRDQDAEEDGLRARWAAGDVDVDWEGSDRRRRRWRIPPRRCPRRRRRLPRRSRRAGRGWPPPCGARRSRGCA